MRESKRKTSLKREICRKYRGGGALPGGKGDGEGGGSGVAPGGKGGGDGGGLGALPGG